MVVVDNRLSFLRADQMGADQDFLSIVNFQYVFLFFHIYLRSGPLISAGWSQAIAWALSVSRSE